MTEEFLRSAAERAREVRVRAVDAVIEAERATRRSADVREEPEALLEAARLLRKARGGPYRPRLTS